MGKKIFGHEEGRSSLIPVWFQHHVRAGTKEGNLGNTGDTEGARYDFYIF